MESLEVDGTQVDNEMADDAGVGLLWTSSKTRRPQVPKQPLTSSSTSSSFGMLSASSFGMLSAPAAASACSVTI